VQDCHGDWGGTAYLDSCAICVGGNTGLLPCVQDCFGDWGGTAYLDSCAICVGGNTGLLPCVQDCFGDWGGTAYLDSCATCVGGNTGLLPCMQDCFGDWGGTAYFDTCGVCVGGNTGLFDCDTINAVTDINKNFNFDIVPNPSNGRQLWIKSDHYSGKLQVRWFDLYGKQFGRYEGVMANGYFKLEMNSLIPDGVYIVSISIDNQKPVIKRWVVIDK
jgi:hypothetical protein